jgi:adenine/guanine phosphoribosyltransferase-like PRPP-binding protein
VLGCGATLLGVLTLVRSAGYEPVAALVAVELTRLGGAAALPVPVLALLKDGLAP